MKKQLLAIAVIIGTAFCINAHAQVSVRINIGAQPVWGPTGYDYVEYYYIPDVDAYYDVPRRQYTWYDGGHWVTRRSLPPRYHDFDLYGAHKVVINERDPWIHHDRYRQENARYKGQHDQVVIRDSREERYYANPHHPHHSEWRGNNGQNNPGHQGRGNNQRKEHGNNQGKGHEKPHHDNGNKGHGRGNGK